MLTWSRDVSHSGKGAGWKGTFFSQAIFTHIWSEKPTDFQNFT